MHGAKTKDVPCQPVKYVAFLEVIGANGKTVVEK